MTAEEKITVIQAQEDGVPLQFRAKPDPKTGDPGFANGLAHYGTEWHDSAEPDFYGQTYCEFDFAHYDYRITPATGTKGD